MAGSRARKVARAARWVATFAAAAVVVGLGAPLVTRSIETADAHATPSLSPAGRAALASAAALDPATASLRPASPRGYSVPAPPAATTKAAPSTAPPSSTPAPVRSPAPAPPPAVGGGLPLVVPVGSSTQVVTVVAPSSGSTTATVTAWQLGPSGWTVAVGPVKGSVGQYGVGAARESVPRTPAGTFTLSEAFGRLANPGTGLPYRVLDSQDWWVGDGQSPLYNQHARCPVGACPFDTNPNVSEHLIDANPAYNYAVVIDYNRWPAVPGAGSAFFFHVSNGAPTAGCVAIPQNSLVAIMKWLNPAAHPLISIGVG